MFGNILNVGRWSVYCRRGHQRHCPRKSFILYDRVNVLKAGMGNKKKKVPKPFFVY